MSEKKHIGYWEKYSMSKFASKRSREDQIAKDFDCMSAELASAMAEIERLKTSPTIEACRQMIENAAVKEASELHKQLAAEQAKNVGLLEALSRLQEACDMEDDNEFYAANSAATKILATPSDTSALEDIVKKAGEKMREKCANLGAVWNSYKAAARDLSIAIRALPAVTLNDITKRSANHE